MCNGCITGYPIDAYVIIVLLFFSPLIILEIWDRFFREKVPAPEWYVEAYQLLNPTSEGNEYVPLEPPENGKIKVDVYDHRGLYRYGGYMDYPQKRS